MVGGRKEYIWLEDKNRPVMFLGGQEQEGACSEGIVIVWDEGELLMLVVSPQAGNLRMLDRSTGRRGRRVSLGSYKH